MKKEKPSTSATLGCTIGRVMKLSSELLKKGRKEEAEECYDYAQSLVWKIKGMRSHDKP